MNSRHPWIVAVEWGSTLAETRGWNEVECRKRKESDKVVKVVAQANKLIFYIGLWFKYLEKELRMDKSPDVLETRTMDG